ncbi:hypothetical protein Ancab_006132 [Ancistrocladus abbreviatus]
MAMAVGIPSTNTHPSSTSSSYNSKLFQQSASSAVVTRSTAQKKKPPPTFISTNPSHINLYHLSQLYTSCNHSYHRFPNLDADGCCIDPVDVDKLRVAVEHSSVVVSVYSRIDKEEEASWQKMLPVTPVSGRLVGFGRAVSDVALTASIYDVMVTPCLRRMGIGRMIVQKILRMLTNRGIYDIVALCSDNQRLFFQACGFGDDILGSTTMMYSRTSLNQTEGCQTVQAGRKLLLLPPPPSFN